MNAHLRPKFTPKLLIVLIATLLNPALTAAQTEAPARSAVTMDELLKLLQDQQQQLNAQNEQIGAQNQLINKLQAQSDGQVADQKQRIQDQEQRKAMQSMQARIDALAVADPAARSAYESALFQRILAVPVMLKRV
jgi:hypothetical protein